MACPGSGSEVYVHVCVCERRSQTAGVTGSPCSEGWPSAFPDVASSLQRLAGMSGCQGRKI